MFQQDALLLWKTRLENVLLRPILRGKSRFHASKEARLWLERVGLRDYKGRSPSQLSSGQRKRGGHGTGPDPSPNVCRNLKEEVIATYEQ